MNRWIQLHILVCLCGVWGPGLCATQTTLAGRSGSLPEALAGPARADRLNQLALTSRDADRLASIAYAYQAIHYSRSIRYQAGEALGMKNAGIICFFLGQNDSAVYYYTKALSLFESLGDKQGISACYNNLGLVYQETGSYEKALTNYGRSMKLDQMQGDSAGLANTLINMAEVMIFQGQNSRAILTLTRALRAFVQLHDTTGIYGVLNDRSACYDNLMKTELALADNQQAMAMAGQQKNRYMMARLLSNRAYYLHHAHRTDEAFGCVQQALDLSNEDDDAYGIYNTYYILAELLTYRGQYHESDFFLQKALRKSEEMGNRRVSAKILTSIGRNLLEINEVDKAKGYFSESLKLANEIGARQEIGPNLYNLLLVASIERDFQAADSLDELYLASQQALSPEDNLPDGPKGNGGPIASPAFHSYHIVLGSMMFLLILLLSILVYRTK